MKQKETGYENLEYQVTVMLGLTGTLNMLDAIEHVKTLKHLLATTEYQRKEWADMCIKKQAKIEELERDLNNISFTL